MNCKVCLNDPEVVEFVNEQIDEGLPFKQIVTLVTRDHPEIKMTIMDLRNHRKHLLPAQSGKALFYVKDNQIFDAKTDQPVTDIPPKTALQVVVTLGAMQILRTGGEKISARYVVEASKILAELGQDDTIAKAIADAWSQKLKEKPAQVVVTERPYEATDDYAKDQAKLKDDFLNSMNKKLRPDVESE